MTLCHILPERRGWVNIIKFKSEREREKEDGGGGRNYMKLCITWQDNNCRNDKTAKTVTGSFGIDYNFFFFPFANFQQLSIVKRCSKGLICNKPSGILIQLIIQHKIFGWRVVNFFLVKALILHVLNFNYFFFLASDFNK